MTTDMAGTGKFHRRDAEYAEKKRTKAKKLIILKREKSFGFLCVLCVSAVRKLELIEVE